MRSVDIRNFAQYDTLTQREHRRTTRRVVIAVALAVIVAVEAAYLLWWSPLFALGEIRVTGVDASRQASIQAAIRKTIGSTRSLFGVDANEIADELRADNPDIESVVVRKQYRHDLDVAVQLRRTIGVWCQPQACVYFDRAGAEVGPAPRATGSLLLLVDDRRSRNGQVIDPEFFTIILAAVDQLAKEDLTVSQAVISANTMDEIQLTLLDQREVLLDRQVNITRQLSALTTLLAEHRTDATFQFRRFDLRIDGRIYYR